MQRELSDPRIIVEARPGSVFILPQKSTIAEGLRIFWPFALKREHSRSMTVDRRTLHRRRRGGDADQLRLGLRED
jgi:hypothetical protein